MSDAGYSLLWLATAYHPDAPTRSAARALVACDEPTECRDLDGELTAILQAEQGTAFEPFVLQADDMPLIHAIARCAFRDGTAEAPRLLIVSRDKLTPQGGVLVNRSPDGPPPLLAARYVERLALRSQLVPDDVWRFAPGLLPDRDRVAARWPRAVLRVDDRGYCLEAGPFEEDRYLIYAVPSASTIGQAGRQVTWRDFRLSVDVVRRVDGQWLSIRPETPEAAIRLSAAMVAGETVSVRVPEVDRAFAGVVARLAIPEAADPIALDSLPIIGPAISSMICDWLDVPESDGRTPDPDTVLIRTIGGWFGIVPEWVDLLGRDA